MTGGGRSPDLATSPFEDGWVSALHSTDDQLDTLLMPNREKDDPMTTETRRRIQSARDLLADSLAEVVTADQANDMADALTELLAATVAARVEDGAP